MINKLELISKALDSNLDISIKENLINTILRGSWKDGRIGNSPPNKGISLVDKDKVIERIERGETLQSIGDEYNVSRERVRQIYKQETGLGVGDVKNIKNTRICEICGNEYLSNRIIQRVCSSECRVLLTLYTHNTLDICENCGLGYIDPRSLGNHHGHFCSKKCMGKDLAKKYGFGSPNNPAGNTKSIEEKRSLLIQRYFNTNLLNEVFSLIEFSEKFQKSRGTCWLLLERAISLGIIKKNFKTGPRKPNFYSVVK